MSKNLNKLQAQEIRKKKTQQMTNPLISNSQSTEKKTVLEAARGRDTLHSEEQRDGFQ